MPSITLDRLNEALHGGPDGGFTAEWQDGPEDTPRVLIRSWGACAPRPLPQREPWSMTVSLADAGAWPWQEGGVALPPAAVRELLELCRQAHPTRWAGWREEDPRRSKAKER